MAELLGELLDRCRRNEAEAWRSLVLRFSGYARELATAILRDPHLAEDAVQTAWLAVLVRLGELREDRSFPAWLRQIVRNESLQLLRTPGSRRCGPEALPCELAASTYPDELLRQELIETVRCAVASLPSAGRDVVELFYLDEQPGAEVARKLGVPDVTVRRRLHDARRRLRAALAGFSDDGEVPPMDSDQDTNRLPL